MPLKRKFNFALLLTFILLIIILFCVVVGFIFYLPNYIESRFLPKITEKFGFENFKCDVRRIGLTGADFGSIAIGDSKQKALTIGSLAIDYSPKALFFERYIKRIELNAIEIFIEIINGKLLIHGLELNRFLKHFQSDSQKPFSSANLSPKIPIGNLQILNALLALNWEGNYFLFPFEFKINTKNTKGDLLHCALHLYLRGRKILCTAEIDLTKHTVSLALEPITIDSPISIKFSQIKSSFKISQNTIESALNFIIDLKKSNNNPSNPLEIIESIPIHAIFTSKLSKEGKWEFKLTHTNDNRFGSMAKNLKFKIRDLDIASKTPRIHISGNGRGSKGNVEYDLIIPALKMKIQSAVIYSPFISFKGKVEFDEPEKMNNVKSENNKSGIFRLTGVSNLEDATITDSESKTTLTGISLNIPLTWPSQDLGREGKIAVKEIKWQNMDIGSLQGFVQQKGSGFIFKADLKNKLISELIPNLQGKFDISSFHNPQTDIRFELLYNPTDTIIDLGKFLPIAMGFKFAGGFKTDASLTIDRKEGIKFYLNSELKDVSIWNKKKEISVEGINLSILIPDLFQICRAPVQQFSFKTASFSKLNSDGGRIEFQVEPDRSLFIEKSSFDWCGGKVFGQALRISPAVEDYHVVLYCDRLNLASVLQQFGIAEAEGEGTVNGRIPLRLKNNKLIFEDGFLFSTPGSGGTIHLPGTQMPNAGIAKQTPQYMQIDLAREALKDFHYNWAKVRVLTKDKDLILRLQLDGKPSKPLPFIYKKEVGGFVRVESGAKGSTFQGISLDVNFKLPLNEILQYKEIYQKIQ
ncbi:MAG: YdbH domain-containing protein [Desulfobacterales bacterium]|nr:YdbH domain-containing protein [Desulfobacterales bacterium]